MYLKASPQTAYFWPTFPSRWIIKCVFRNNPPPSGVWLIKNIKLLYRRVLLGYITAIPVIWRQVLAELLEI